MAVQVPMELLPTTVISSVALLFVLAMAITLCSCFNRSSSRTESSAGDGEEALRSLRDQERIKEGEEERSKISSKQLSPDHLYIFFYRENTGGCH